jgi:hypothetical protein
MYTQLASRLYVSPGSPGISPAIPTEGYNRARVDFTLFTGTLDEVQVWGSNDLENWTLQETYVGAWTGPNYQSPVPVSQMETTYIRIHWVCIEEASCTLAGGVNLSSQ